MPTPDATASRFIIQIHVRPADRVSVVPAPLAAQNIVGRVLPQITATGTDTGAILGAVPAFDSVADAVAETGADASIILASPEYIADAVAEAAAAGLEMVVVMAHGLDATRPVPAANDHRPHDFASAMRRVEQDYYAAV